MLPYFYDAQMRRLVLHFMRIFNGIKVLSGKDENGIAEFTTVPVQYGDAQGQALAVLQGNSENTVQPVPRISVYIQDIELAEDRLGYAGNYDTSLVTERKWNEEDGKYESVRGTDYHIDRLQYRPIDVIFSVDIWTSNTDQKFQLFEQIILLFNPTLEIQKTTNPLDWTSINHVRLTDVRFDNQGIPKGSDEDPHTMTFTFRANAHISPPARVKQQKLIHAVIQGIGEGASFEDMLGWDCDGDVTQTISTPGDFAISVEGNEITLLGKYKNVQTPDGMLFSFPKLIDQYGELKDNFSKIRLRWNGNIHDDTQDIIGFISYHPTEDNKLIFTPDLDTIPVATLDAINSIIDPHYSSPGDDLPAAVLGQRYLITSDLGPNSQAWGTSIDAKANDIIEYDGSEWVISYDASSSITPDIVLNSSTGTRFRFVENEWIDFINDVYLPGYWRLQLYSGQS